MKNKVITLEMLLNEPIIGSFGISRNEKGEISSPHNRSHYLHAQDREYLTFDSSNNKALANMLWDGSLKFVSFFRPTYWVDIAPGESTFFPCAIIPIGDKDTLDELNCKTALEWLCSTANVLSDITGQLSIPDDPLLADMLIYSIMQCHNSPVMDAE